MSKNKLPPRWRITQSEHTSGYIIRDYRWKTWCVEEMLKGRSSYKGIRLFQVVPSTGKRIHCVGIYATVEIAKRVAIKYENCTNRLVDYAACPKRSRGGQNSSPKKYLTALGNQIIEQARNLIPSAAIGYYGINAKGMYLKWLVEGKDLHARKANPDEIFIYRDWLLDQGLLVELTHQETEVSEPVEKPIRKWIKLDIQ